MSFVAVAIGGSALVGGLVASSAASKSSKAATQAADTQAAAANHAADLQNQQYQQTRDDYAPWRAAGSAALGVQSDLLGFNGQPAQTNAFANFRADPGYQYNVDQAVQGVDRSAAARGLLTSGATIKAIQDRAANLADQGYSNYFNRLAGVAGTGQTATSGTASAGTAAATNEGNSLISGANARASGYVNSANASAQGSAGVASALNGGLNNWFSYNGAGGGINPVSWNGTQNSTGGQSIYQQGYLLPSGGV